MFMELKTKANKLSKHNDVLIQLTMMLQKYEKLNKSS